MAAHRVRDVGPYVASLRHETRIAEALHELRPRARDAAGLPAEFRLVILLSGETTLRTFVALLGLLAGTMLLLALVLPTRADPTALSGSKKPGVAAVPGGVKKFTKGPPAA